MYKFCRNPKELKAYLFIYFDRLPAIIRKNR